MVRRFVIGLVLAVISIFGSALPAVADPWPPF